MFFKKSVGVQLYYKETPTQVFSCEICEMFKNIFLFRTPPVAASMCPKNMKLFCGLPREHIVFVSSIFCLSCLLLIFQGVIFSSSDHIMNSIRAYRRSMSNKFILQMLDIQMEHLSLLKHFVSLNKLKIVLTFTKLGKTS